MVAITTPSPIRPLARPTGGRSLHAVPDASNAAQSPAGWPLARFVGLVALVLVVVAALGYLATSTPTTPGTVGAPATLEAHVVAEGETMWSIAQDVAPAGEAATYVERLVSANGGAAVAPGQVLTVPVP